MMGLPKSSKARYSEKCITIETFNYIGITFACFIISGNVPDKKDKLIKSKIDFENYFLNSLRILVGMLQGSIDLYVLSIPRISSTSFFVAGNMKKEFLTALFKYESTFFNVFWYFCNKSFSN